MGIVWRGDAKELFELFIPSLWHIGDIDFTVEHLPFQSESKWNVEVVGRFV